ncbi:MAG: hypothetical protein ACE5F1_01995, partial [Planctomycetota bacterium]
MDRTSHRRNEVGLPSLARVFLLLGLLSGTAPLSLTQELGRQPGELLRVASYNVENLFDNFDDPYRPDEGTSPKSLIELSHRRVARRPTGQHGHGDRSAVGGIP